MDEGILNFEEAVNLLKTSKPTFYRWIRENKVKGFKVGREWRFYRTDLMSFLESSDQDKEALKKELRQANAYFAERLKKKGVEGELFLFF